jgi:ankyrin repeat protein
MKRTKERGKSRSATSEDTEGLTPFQLAIVHGKLGDIVTLFQENPTVLIERTPHNQTPFHLAVKRGSASVCTFLFSLEGTTKSLVNAKDSKGLTCLHLAACGSNHELLLWLLKQDRVNVRAKTSEEETTLHLLAKYFPVVEEEVVRILLLVLLIGPLTNAGRRV